jgi:cation transport regulator ChaB
VRSGSRKRHACTTVPASAVNNCLFDGGCVTMPKTTKGGQPKKNELPSTLRKSPPKAQRTFAKAHDSAVKQYGEGERAHRVAYDALKHSFEKIGDHWEPKSQKGPSDSRARSGGPNPKGTSAEGVDANASKKHLVEVARRLDISGRSTMSKGELVSAIKKANRRVSARSR